MMMDRAGLENALYARLQTRLPAHVLEDIGPPLIEWHPASNPPIGETPVFFWDGGEMEIHAAFAPDDALLLRYRRGDMIRMDAWKHGQRGVVFDWTRENADLN